MTFIWRKNYHQNGYDSDDFDSRILQPLSDILLWKIMITQEGCGDNGDVD